MGQGYDLIGMPRKSPVKTEELCHREKHKIIACLNPEAKGKINWRAARKCGGKNWPKET